MAVQDIIRIDICHSSDPDCEARLIEVIAGLGGRGDGDADDPALGAGVSRFQIGGEELTVYKDAWGVDVAGPERLVRRVLAGMAGS
jgi:hypothetical protein